MTVKIAVIGAGYWSEECHVPGLREAPEAEIVALVGRRKDVVSEQAKRLGIPKVYTDYQEMFAKEQLDAITITTPNNVHKEIAIHAMKKGLHVFCEKPLALDSREALAMALEAENSGVINHVGFTFRFLQGVNKAKEVIATGLIGKIFHARLWAENDSGLAVRPLVWRDTATLAGSGQLGDMGSHIFDLYRYVTGDEFSSVYARSLAVQNVRGKDGKKVSASVDDFNSLMFETKSQVTGLAVASRVTRGQGGWSIELFGTEGALRLVYSRGLKDELWYAPKGNEYRLIGVPYIEGDYAMLQMMEAFVAEIANRAPISQGKAATFYDGLKAQDVIEACLKSSSMTTSARVDNGVR